MKNVEIGKANKEFRISHDVGGLDFRHFNKIKMIERSVKLNHIVKEPHYPEPICCLCGEGFEEGEISFRKNYINESCCKKCFFEWWHFTPDEFERIVKILRNCVRKDYEVFKKYEVEVDKHNVILKL